MTNPPSPPEHCDRAGAARLQARLETYWTSKGLPIATAIVRSGRDGGGGASHLRRQVYGVRSSLQRGLPVAGPAILRPGDAAAE
jgi:hypothetical protein